MIGRLCPSSSSGRMCYFWDTRCSRCKGGLKGCIGARNKKVSCVDKSGSCGDM